MARKNAHSFSRKQSSRKYSAPDHHTIPLMVLGILAVFGVLLYFSGITTGGQATSLEIIQQQVIEKTAQLKAKQAELAKEQQEYRWIEDLIAIKNEKLDAVSQELADQYAEGDTLQREFDDHVAVDEGLLETEIGILTSEQVTLQDKYDQQMVDPVLATVDTEYARVQEEYYAKMDALEQEKADRTQQSYENTAKLQEELTSKQEAIANKINELNDDYALLVEERDIQEQNKAEADGRIAQLLDDIANLEAEIARLKGDKEAAQDLDRDGVKEPPHGTDNCPNAYNPDQADSDGDGVGDACDTCPNTKNDDDSDQDCVANTEDNCVNDYNTLQGDADGDGVGDVCDDTPPKPVLDTNCFVQVQQNLELLQSTVPDPEVQGITKYLLGSMNEWSDEERSTGVVFPFRWQELLLGRTAAMTMGLPKGLARIKERIPKDSLPVYDSIFSCISKVGNGVLDPGEQCESVVYYISQKERIENKNWFTAKSVSTTLFTDTPVTSKLVVAGNERYFYTQVGRPTAPVRLPIVSSTCANGKECVGTSCLDVPSSGPVQAPAWGSSPAFMTCPNGLQVPVYKSDAAGNRIIVACQEPRESFEEAKEKDLTKCSVWDLQAGSGLLKDNSRFCKCARGDVSTYVYGDNGRYATGACEAAKQTEEVACVEPTAQEVAAATNKYGEVEGKKAEECWCQEDGTSNYPELIWSVV